MMRTYARLRGLRRLMSPVPLLTPRLVVLHGLDGLGQGRAELIEPIREAEARGLEHDRLRREFERLRRAADT